MALILDVAVGSRKMYHGWDKRLGAAQFIGMDIRKGDFSIRQKDYPDCVKKGNLWKDHIIKIFPTLQADMRYIPLKDQIVDVIVFDPPHLDRGLDTFFGHYYGSWSQTEVIRTCRMANEEFKRVLRPMGLLILKIMPRDFPLYETLLKNFCFFLPIQTKRSRGSLKKKSVLSDAEAALWCIGILKMDVSVDPGCLE